MARTQQEKKALKQSTQIRTGDGKIRPFRELYNKANIDKNNDNQFVLNQLNLVTQTNTILQDFVVSLETKLRNLEEEIQLTLENKVATLEDNIRNIEEVRLIPIDTRLTLAEAEILTLRPQVLAD